MLIFTTGSMPLHHKLKPGRLMKLSSRINFVKAKIFWTAARYRPMKIRDDRLLRELNGKMNFTYMLGFGLVSGVVKVFPVSSLSLARKTTMSTSTMRPDDEMGSQIGRVTSRPGEDMYTRPIARKGHMTSLRSHFVIRPRRAWSIFSLPKDTWPEKLSPHHSPARTLTYSTNEPHRCASNLESVTRLIVGWSPSFEPRLSGAKPGKRRKMALSGSELDRPCTSSRFFAKYTHFAIVFGGSAGRGTLLLWNGGWSIRLAALREELRRSKVRLEPWSSGHYRLLSRPGQAWEVLCLALRGSLLFDPACVHYSQSHVSVHEELYMYSQATFPPNVNTAKAALGGGCTGLVSFALSFATGFRELVDQAADDCACASFQSWMC